MIKFCREKKLFCLLVLLFIILLLGLIIFLIYKFYWLERYQAPEIGRFIPVQEAKENFNSIVRGTSLSGNFLSYDEEKSEIYITSFDAVTMSVITIPFKLNEHTIFSEATFEFDESKLFPVEDLKKIKTGTQIIVYYSDLENQTERVLAKLIQMENLSQPQSP